MNEISVRVAIPGDAPAIARIKIETWRHAYSHILDPVVLANLDEQKESERWRDRIQQFPEDQNALVACYGDKVIGYVVMGPNRFGEVPCDGELQAIYVQPSHHGKGIGRRLMVPAVDWMIEAGYMSMAVFVFRDNPLGVGFYKSIGAEFYNSGELEISGKKYPDEGYVWKSLAALQKLLSAGN